MTKAFASRGLIASIFTALMTGALLSPAAQAVTDTVFRYSTPKTGHLMLPAAAFAPSALSGTLSNNGRFLTSSDAGQKCFQAPVNLPQGAKPTSLRVWYSRQSSGETLGYYIERVQLVGVSNIDTLIIAGSNLTNQMPVNDGYSAAAESITGQTINNKIYAYFMYVCVANNAIFFAGRLDYTYTTAGD